jgi:hypothetical protein
MCKKFRGSIFFFLSAQRNKAPRAYHFEQHLWDVAYLAKARAVIEAAAAHVSAARAGREGGVSRSGGMEADGSGGGGGVGSAASGARGTCVEKEGKKETCLEQISHAVRLVAVAEGLVCKVKLFF